VKVGQYAGAQHIWIEVDGRTVTMTEKQLAKAIEKLKKAKAKFKATANKTPKW
jgi:hypothetical protein